jgi:hypothetical protein
MAHVPAEGARAAGAAVDVKRVPEDVPEAVAKAAHFKLDQPAPFATRNELPKAKLRPRDGGFRAARKETEFSL